MYTIQHIQAPIQFKATDEILDTINNVDSMSAKVIVREPVKRVIEITFLRDDAPSNEVVFALGLLIGNIETASLKQHL